MPEQGEGYKVMIVPSTKKGLREKCVGRNVRTLVLGTGSLVWLSLCVLPCGFPGLTLAGAQTQQPSVVLSGPSSTAGAGASGAQEPNQQSAGSVSGTVVDPSGAAIAGAQVKLTRDDQTASQEAVTDSNGRFSFAGVAPGPFQLEITAASFARQTSAGTLQPGEVHTVPTIALAIAANVQQVTVEPTAVVAQEQIRQEEKQRVLGVVPNFYVSYIPDAAPLNAKQKFELAWKDTLDPVTFVVTGAAAGIEQAGNEYSGYGQGAQGYGKRYGASYADFATSTFIGSAILPSLLKQDPRYFYNGTGSKRSRLLYALENSLICKGDNGRWQPNYSNVFGNLAAGSISNLYYPSNDRGAALTFERAGLGIAATSGVDVLQEFVLRKLTTNFRIREAAKH